jgi:hypothetical protein
MANIERMADRLNLVRGQMLELHANEQEGQMGVHVKVGRIKQEKWPKYEVLRKNDEDFMKYRHEKSEKGMNSQVDLEELYDHNLERNTIEEEYKVTFNDLLPLIFYQINNGVSSRMKEDEMSLSCFSMDELEIGHMLTAKARTKITHPGAENSPSLLDKNFDENQLPPIRDDEVIPQADLMSYIGRFEKNYREVDSRITIPKEYLQLPFENFAWISDRKPSIYREWVPLTKEEKLVGLKCDPKIQEILIENSLLDKRKFFHYKNNTEELFKNYISPKWSMPVAISAKGTAEGIEISEEYYTKLRSELAEGRDKCIDVKLHDKKSVMAALERLDKLFLEKNANLVFQNRMIYEHNQQIEDRNENLTIAGKKINAHISQLREQALKTKELLFQKKIQRDRLMIQDGEELRKDQLILLLNKEKLNLEDAKAREDLLRDSLVRTFHQERQEISQQEIKSNIRKTKKDLTERQLAIKRNYSYI